MNNGLIISLFCGAGFMLTIVALLSAVYYSGTQVKKYEDS